MKKIRRVELLDEVGKERYSVDSDSDSDSQINGSKTSSPLNDSKRSNFTRTAINYIDRLYLNGTLFEIVMSAVKPLPPRPVFENTIASELGYSKRVQSVIRHFKSTMPRVVKRNTTRLYSEF